MHGLRLAILCVVALQGLSGCAFYQFRVWPDYGLLSRSVSATGSASEQQWAAANASLSESLAVGEDLEGKYERYARTHERTIPVLATILIPITATVAGLAITGTTGAPVTALSLAGGSSFAYGTVLSSTQRERIYAQAKTATRCLINVYHPLLVGKDEYVKFREQLATDRYQIVRGRLRDAIDKYPRQTQADRDLADAAEA